MTSLKTSSAVRTLTKAAPPERKDVPDGIEARVARLRERIEEAKRARAAAEARREMALKRKAEIEAQIREMGVDPENVEAEIQRLEAEISENLAKAEELLRPFEELVDNAV
jgi:chromosome segregation ATPase